MPLHRTVRDGPGATIALLHGFTQTEASWRPVAERLAAHHRVVTVDLPGHGRSGPVRADLGETASLVAEAVGSEPVALVGYSMGGRVALRLALDQPQVVAQLVLIGTTAGIDDPAERAARRRHDDQLADRLAAADDLDDFLAEWLAQPLFAGLDPEPDDLAARRANRPRDLAAVLRSTGTGTMDPPWWPDLARLMMPVHVVWGSRDAKFATLGRRLAEHIGPQASTTAVPEAGHAAHLQRPDAVAALLADLLRG